MTPPISHIDAATDFLRLCAHGDVDQAYDCYVAPGFRHHNPYFKGDAASLQAGMRDNARQFPGKALEVLRALQDGPLVAVHSRVRLTSAGPAIALTHWFRFEDGRIVEMWDIGQAEPEQMVNQNGMF